MNKISLYASVMIKLLEVSHILKTVKWATGNVSGYCVTDFYINDLPVNIHPLQSLCTKTFSKSINVEVEIAIKYF